MKNLITGIHGFAASHLADWLLEKNEAVVGLCRSPDNDGNIRHIKDRIEVVACDVSDPEALQSAFLKHLPDRIYHLAAKTYVPAAEEDGSSTFTANFFGTYHLLEAVKKTHPKARVLWVGSSEEYGIVSEEDGPVKETRPLKPHSLYGVSKASADLLAKSYFAREGLDVIRVRAYNHFGPRQDLRFVCSAFARQIALIEKGADPVLRTGNLESYRDFTDVRDTVRAYHAVMQRGSSGEAYNVCSGKPVKIRSILDGLVKLSGIAIEIEPDPELFRPAISVSMRGDSSRLTQATGWRPLIPLEQTLRDLLEFWRERV